MREKCDRARHSKRLAFASCKLIPVAVDTCTLALGGALGIKGLIRPLKGLIRPSKASRQTTVSLMRVFKFDASLPSAGER